MKGMENNNAPKLRATFSWSSARCRNDYDDKEWREIPDGPSPVTAIVMHHYSPDDHNILPKAKTTEALVLPLGMLVIWLLSEIAIVMSAQTQMCLGWHSQQVLKANMV